MKFLLETITPVHIGNSEILSPYNDYYYDEGFIFLLNQDNISQEISRLKNSEEVIDKYINYIKLQAKTNNPQKYNIKNFLQEAGIDLSSVTDVKLKANTRITEEIQRTINTGGRPYIPGSSLKGAIRTALIACEYLENGKFNYDEIERLKKQRKINYYIGQEVFGKSSKDVLKFLAISDTELMPQDVKKVIKTYRFNLKTQKKTIPVVKEVINSKIETTFSLKTLADGKSNNIKPRHNYLLKGNETMLLPKINLFYKKCLEKEICELSKFNNSEISDLVKLYKDLLQEINNMDNNKSAILRIGSGKTIFENTIARIFNSQDLNKWIGKMKSGKGKDFPVSRVVALEQHNIEVCGWVKISLCEK